VAELPGVRRIIAVGSGKGGVGKTTVAGHLALALARRGRAVGLFDADLYGPNVTTLFGLAGKAKGDAWMPVARARREPYIEPVRAQGVAIMSLGLMIPEGRAARPAPELIGALAEQTVRDVRWGPLDYLVIDMPPGTGDIALTLSQALPAPATGAVVVCTPQDVALIDAVKAIAMFRKVNLPVLGMVENMSGFICPDCGKRYDIFGSGGAKATAERLDVPFLGEVPINISIRAHGDEGRTALNFDDPLVTPHLEQIVYRLARHLADKAAAAPPRPSLPVL
jgi:ATP-binding protein involved in chromosome partitioning